MPECTREGVSLRLLAAGMECQISWLRPALASAFGGEPAEQNTPPYMKNGNTRVALLIKFLF
jgi:hypothetical protein